MEIVSRNLRNKIIWENRIHRGIHKGFTRNHIPEHVLWALVSTDYGKAHGICLSGTGLFHYVQCCPIVSIQLQKTMLYFFIAEQYFMCVSFSLFIYVRNSMVFFVCFAVIFSVLLLLLSFSTCHVLVSFPNGELYL